MDVEALQRKDEKPSAVMDTLPSKTSAEKLIAENLTASTGAMADNMVALTAVTDASSSKTPLEKSLADDSMASNAVIDAWKGKPLEDLEDNSEAFRKAVQEHGLVSTGANNGTLPASSLQSDAVRTRVLFMNRSLVTSNALSAPKSLQVEDAQRHATQNSPPASSLQSDAARTNSSVNSSTKCLGGYTPLEAGILECPEGYTADYVRGMSRVFFALWIIMIAFLVVLLLEVLKSKKTPAEALPEALSIMWARARRLVQAGAKFLQRGSGPVGNLHKDSGAGVLAFLADELKNLKASDISAAEGEHNLPHNTGNENNPLEEPGVNDKHMANVQGVVQARNSGLLHQIILRLVLRPWQQVCCRRRPARSQL